MKEALQSSITQTDAKKSSWNTLKEIAIDEIIVKLIQKDDFKAIVISKRWKSVLFSYELKDRAVEAMRLLMVNGN